VRSIAEVRSGERGSPFDVFSERVGRFLATFLILWAALTSLVAYSRIISAHNTPLAWHETATITITAAAITVGIAFPLSIAIIEGIPMVFAHFIRQRHREQGREEGRTEGRTEGREEGREEGLQRGEATRQNLWEEWNGRRLLAEQNGQPFDEPPPTLTSGNGANDSPIN
jgi:MFS superfamily sulfate permease-like transporter